MDEQQPMTKDSYFIGKVQTIFFEAQDSFYKVGSFLVEENNFDWSESEIVVTGSFGDLQEGMDYLLTGQVVQHARYGQQFQVTSYKSQGTSTETGLINYLASALFTGIGRKTAERIVELLGLDAINLILESPDVLTPLKLNKTKQKLFVEQLQKNNGMEKIVIGLSQLGFSANMTAVIYETYQDAALNVIQENPYQLIEDIDGISFKKADQLAQLVGIPLDADIRIGASIISVLANQSFNTGDVYQDINLVLSESQKLLRNNKVIIDKTKVQEVLIEFAKNKKIIAEGSHIYLADLYNAEWRIAEHLKRISKLGVNKQFNSNEISETLTKVEKMLDVKYDKSQKNAIIEAINEPIFILTGGPGTGKTTIINGFVMTFALLHEIDLDLSTYKKDTGFPILLAAPTGRAAKRLSESTDLPAKTIHRLLGLTGREKNKIPDIDELKGTLLIIDEMSMVDTQLFDILLTAIPLKMQVILVGDKDQLPSVGPGQIFADLINGQQFKQIELTHIHRQAQLSSIIPLAHAIKQGQIPTDLTSNQVDRSFIFAHANQVETVIKQVIEKAQKKGFANNDVQILAPMYRGIAGIDNLNTSVQNVLNPLNSQNKRQVEFNKQFFRVGDKVLQLVNSPESNVFNGDIGKIVAINLAKDRGNEAKVDQLTIAFDSGEIVYPRSEWQKITLAYAISIHKAQGSEFELVILPLVNAYSNMLQRNLLYTGLTRASKKLVIIGEPTAFEQAVNNIGSNRKTTLTQRIETIYHTDEVMDVSVPNIDIQNSKNNKLEVKETADNYEVFKEDTLASKVKEVNPDGYRLTKTKIENQTINPLIGMNDLSPFDFMSKS